MSRLQLVRLIFLLLAAVVRADTVTYDWQADWISATPDGVTRPVIGINGEWPCPSIEASVGDEVVVRLTNNLGNQTTGLHFHGMRQIQTNFMDGASVVTQCPLGPGDTITYRFTVDVPGTYWYHSHNMGQYVDGLRGALLVYDPDDPYSEDYDEEEVVTLSDWYHEQTIYLSRFLLSPQNEPPAPPGIDSILVNDVRRNPHFHVDKNKTYRLRFINLSAAASFMLNFEEVDAQVIAIDGYNVRRARASMVRIAPAQRYDILVCFTDTYSDNIPFLIALDGNPDYTNPELRPRWPLNLTGQFISDPDAPLRRNRDVTVWRPMDDSRLEPFGDYRPLSHPNRLIQLEAEFCQDQYNIPRACFNHIPYVLQKVPTLYTAATVGEHNTNPVVYGAVNPFILSQGDIVDIVVNNHDDRNHPFHLHGHHFEVLDRPCARSGVWPGPNATHINEYPPLRDTVDVMAHSYVVIRFLADNPGVHLFHCHIEWHVEMGLTATLILGPEKLRGLDIPQDHLDSCRRIGMPTAGNAGGDLENPLHTWNMNDKPPRFHAG
ncbi:iron transport multicopper oxidase FET3 [Sodiomyces alkalinus F11]|uniref:Iron transport multicopper oxidase FET3 n=1 Tax=Sodiomyces alkalinus (strain CBS 110278 / VKM F-3762 / F11) TaxID=1314773 RepID=A0A3N2Q3Y4_SODAK|nr:iron transport multicopper oxidase FET3 [Sodiomyces alkalinus F11]ROT41462.1 iron transport multicopper oxidase FET3 [Sodiomyces alkalinus F11]